MDYRKLQEKYGNKVNKALTDLEYINWLIDVLREEGFGTAKQVIMADGFKTRAIKLNEDELQITYRIDAFEARNPIITSTLTNGNSLEWGQEVLASTDTVDFTITRTSYPLFSVAFTGVDEADKDEQTIDDAGVNDDLLVDFEWLFTGVPIFSDLLLGAVEIGTIAAVDDKGQTTLHSIQVERHDRWIWGITNGIEGSSSIATEIGTRTGDILPEDDDPFFYKLQSGVGSFPADILVDTYGSERTLFIIDITNPDFVLESTIPFEIPDVQQTISLIGISGGVANAVREYPVQTINLNTLVKLIKI